MSESVKLKYTFLLPAYKSAFLRRSIESILSQNRSDFQVIVSDDCSPEGLESIVSEFLADQRIIYRRNEQNIGAEHLVSHWNLLLGMCESEWVIMASDDDIYDPTFLAEVDDLLMKHPHVDLARARVRKITGTDETISVDGIYDECTPELEFLAMQHNNVNVKCVGNYVFRTKALKEKGGFVNFPYAWFSDTATAIMMAENGCVNTSVPLFHYRASGLNISTKKDSPEVAKKKTQSAYLFYEWLRNRLSSLSRIEGDAYHKCLCQFCWDEYRKDRVTYTDCSLFDCSLSDFIHLVFENYPSPVKRLTYILRYAKLRLSGKS